MPINVKVTDDDTGSATGSTAVEVTNVAPSIDTISGPQTIVEGQSNTHGQATLAIESRLLAKEREELPG
jgi:hypothetical protein